MSSSLSRWSMVNSSGLHVCINFRVYIDATYIEFNVLYSRSVVCCVVCCCCLLLLFSVVVVVFCCCCCCLLLLLLLFVAAVVVVVVVVVVYYPYGYYCYLLMWVALKVLVLVPT